MTMKNQSNLYERASQGMNKGNYIKKIYKAKEKNTLGGKVNRSGPRGRQVCEEWLNVVAENSVSEGKQ